MDSSDVLAQSIDRLTATLERMVTAIEQIRENLESELVDDETEDE